MRHGDKLNNLGRTSSHRRALMSNITCSLIAHKRIMTTLAKAKALRVYAEPLITRSKVDSMHNRRVVFSYLQDKEAIKELFGVIGDKVANRPGGYTRIVKMPRRAGDAADMALIELVDFNDIYKPNESADGAKKTRRSRRSGTATPNVSKTDTTTAPSTEETTAPAAEVATEEVVATPEATVEAPATPEVEAPTAAATPATEAPKTEEQA